MEKLSVTVRGDSMWPTLKDGDVVTCNSYQGETVLEAVSYTHLTLPTNREV